MNQYELKQAKRYADAFAFHAEQELRRTPGASASWKAYMHQEVDKARDLSGRIDALIEVSREDAA